MRAADAHDLEIPVVELGKLAARGQIRHVAYGLYRFDDLPPARFDRFFGRLLVWAGDAHSRAMRFWRCTNWAGQPQVVRVGTSRRVRAQLPKWIAIEAETLPDGDLTSYESIRRPRSPAIRTCRDTVMSDRLLVAVDDARRDGLLSVAEQREFRAELEGAA
ncbi:MAG: hypothetical protein IPQ14_10685 [Candidatus Microthrix sp.]|uniref:hypothetical protein n=1 Tax=Candidatus Neomicrothrix sp. TaxID=2719034 RepID=UPI0025BA99C9|nr:hypothetical protein [Candidatus Microthrix sp.]MBL0204764.1 hypothetical protein [Candidatus Microthrix sp.]